MSSGKLTLKCKEGHDIYVSSSYMIVDEKTDSPKMFCIDMDLTSEKRKKIN
jgi:hypothetical protein